MWHNRWSKFYKLQIHKIRSQSATASESISQTSKCWVWMCFFCDRFRVVWMVILSRQEVRRGRSFRSWASVSRRRSAATESLTAIPLPPLTFSWPWLRFVVASIMLENTREKGSVSRGFLFFYYYSFSLSFHYHPVGRRLSFCFGTHSLHTVGKSLNKKKILFYNR